MESVQNKNEIIIIIKLWLIIAAVCPLSLRFNLASVNIPEIFYGVHGFTGKTVGECEIYPESSQLNLGSCPT